MIPADNRSRSRSRSRGRAMTSRIQSKHDDEKVTSKQPSQHSQSVERKSQFHQHQKEISFLDSFDPKPNDELRRRGRTTRSTSRSRSHGLGSGTMGETGVHGRSMNAFDFSVKHDSRAPAPPPTSGKQRIVPPSPAPSFYSVPRRLPIPDSPTPANCVPPFSYLFSSSANYTSKGQTSSNARKRPAEPSTTGNTMNNREKTHVADTEYVVSKRLPHVEGHRSSTSEFQKANQTSKHPRLLDIMEAKMNSGLFGTKTDSLLQQQRAKQFVLNVSQSCQQQSFPDVKIVTVPSSDGSRNDNRHAPASECNLISTKSRKCADSDKRSPVLGSSHYFDKGPARRIPSLVRIKQNNAACEEVVTTGLKSSSGNVHGNSESLTGMLHDTSSTVANLMRNGNVTVTLTSLLPKNGKEATKLESKPALDEVEVIIMSGNNSDQSKPPQCLKNETKEDQQKSFYTKEGLCQVGDHDVDNTGIVDSEIISQLPDSETIEVDLDKDPQIFDGQEALHLNIVKGSISSNLNGGESDLDLNQEDSTVAVPFQGRKFMGGEDGGMSNPCTDKATEESSDDDEFVDSCEDLRELNYTDDQPQNNAGMKEKKRRWCSIA